MSFLTPAAERRTIVPSLTRSADWSAAVDYPHVQQQLSNWCWAACAAMVAEKKQGQAVTQCSIVRSRLVNPACCNNPIPAACNQPLQTNAMTVLLRKYSPTTVQVAAPGQSLLVQQLQGAAVVALWQWNDTSNGLAYHYVLIAGRVPGSGEFQLHDPRFEEISHVSFDALRTAGGQGKWIAAWRVRT